MLVEFWGIGQQVVERHVLTREAKVDGDHRVRLGEVMPGQVLEEVPLRRHDVERDPGDDADQRDAEDRKDEQLGPERSPVERLVAHGCFPPSPSFGRCAAEGERKVVPTSSRSGLVGGQHTLAHAVGVVRPVADDVPNLGRIPHFVARAA